MKKMKFAILVIVSIIVILIMLLFLIKPKMEDAKNIINDEDIGEGDSYANNIEEVEDANIFYSISYTIEKYVDNLYLNDGFTDEEVNKNKERIINVLDKRFIKENNISKENVIDFIGQKQQTMFTATEIKQLLSESTYQKYYVRGFIENAETNKYLKDMYFVVTIDTDNNTYVIYPMISKQYSDLSEIKIDTDEIETIEKNNDNQFIIISVNQSNLVNRYVNYYIHMALNNPEMAYEMLDEEYKKKRFDGLYNYINYINENKNNLENVMLSKYKEKEYDNYTQYIVLDKWGNYYIFNQTSIMKFNIILDNYSIDMPEFIERYDRGNNEERAGLNITRFFEALNSKNYDYTYSKLNETFRNNTFKNKGSFKNYMEEKLFGYNYITYENSETKGNLQIFSIKVSDKEENGQIVNMDIIVKLREDRNFEMSFEIK